MPRQQLSMVRVALLGSLMLSAQISVVWADEWLLRDRDGRPVEVITARPGDRLTRRDAETGARRGSIEHAAGGRLILRDPDGRRVGTVELRANGGRMVRDRDGRRLYEIRPGGGERHVIRDRDGRRQGEVERR